VLAIAVGGGPPALNFTGGWRGGDGSEPVCSVLGEDGEGEAEKWSRRGGAERLVALKAGVGSLGPSGRHPAGDAGTWRPQGGHGLRVVGTFASARGRGRHGAGRHVVGPGRFHRPD
jgi:hypothetical protein